MRNIEKMFNRLDELAQLREESRAAARETMDEMGVVAAKLIDSGVLKVEVAERAGISRVTLDRLLNR